MIFYKCPHCSADLGFAPTSHNKIHRSKTCPRCGKDIALRIHWPSAVLSLLAIGAVAYIAVKLGVPGADSPLAAGIVGVLFAGFFLEVRPR